MNKKTIAAAACGFTFIVAFFATIILLKSSLPGSAAMATDIAPRENVVAEGEVREQDKYILKEYGGNICVFYGAFQEIPAIITDIRVDSLTTIDRELLFHGIEVFGRQEVLKLLEDFGS
ncbi:MAG: hypothetical protein GX254_01030 [Clostridiales bacterium]|jgi:hypothetical protein|nr:hypothetical protein [Clostridiales bacterium]